MNTIAKELELPGAFILGAGAVSSKTVGMNGEVMANCLTTWCSVVVECFAKNISLTHYCVLKLVPLVLTEHEGKPAVNASYFSSINPADGKCLQEKYSNRFCDCDFGLLANLYACKGQPGKVRVRIVHFLCSEYTGYWHEIVNDTWIDYDEMMVKQVVRPSHRSREGWSWAWVTISLKRYVKLIWWMFACSSSVCLGLCWGFLLLQWT